MKRLQILLILAAVLGSVSCVFGQARTPRHLTKKTTESGGINRTYYVFEPGGVARSEKLPVVMIFHGGGGTALRMERWLNFTDLARREKFIAVYPDGISNNWNDGRETKVNRAHKDKIDDLSFISKLLDEVIADYPVDKDRIYATGPSNGGIFSHFIAAQMADRIAAIAPVIGGIADPFYKSFAPSEPVSVFVIQGTRDKLVPYEGGVIGRNRGRVISTDETIRLWTSHNKTDSKVVKGNLPDTDKKDGCTVETYSWNNGSKGTEVVLYKLIGGGHTWPGGSQYAPRFIVGEVCRDFDATEAVWQFFKSHPKNRDSDKPTPRSQ